MGCRLLLAGCRSLEGSIAQAECVVNSWLTSFSAEDVADQIPQAGVFEGWVYVLFKHVEEEVVEPRGCPNEKQNERGGRPIRAEGEQPRRRHQDNQQEEDALYYDQPLDNGAVASPNQANAPFQNSQISPMVNLLALLSLPH